MAILKLQYIHYEPGEFTKEIVVDKENMLALFDDKTTFVLITRSYTIRIPLIKFFIRSEDNYLYIEHIKQNEFKVSYCSTDGTNLLEGNYYIHDVRKILELFMDARFEVLDKAIPRSNDNVMHLKSLFINHDFIYTYKEKNVFMLVAINILSLFFFFFIFVSVQNIYAEMASTFILLFVFFYLRLHFNYIKKSKNISIQVSSGTYKVVIWDGLKPYEFRKSDILEIRQYICYISRLPFHFYSFSRIILNDYQHYDISSMVLHHDSLKFKMASVKFRRISKIYPFIGRYKPNNQGK
jgi:hypothetical protein